MRYHRSSQNAPIDKELVLIGGGHAHVGVIRNFAMRPEPGVRLTVISRDIETPYSGMLPGLIAGHYTYAQTHIDLLPLCRWAGARLYHAPVEGLDLVNQTVVIPGRPPVYFDLLSINTGSTPTAENIPGVKEYALPVKPVDAFLREWEKLTKRVLASTGEFRLAVVGSGAGGVELILSMRHHLCELLNKKGQDSKRLVFSIVSQDHEILSSHNPSVRERFKKILLERGVGLVTGHSVIKVTEDSVITHNDEIFAADAVVWVTNAAAPSWPKESGLAVDDRGFIRLDQHLQSVSHNNVFAAGDIASLPQSRPKSGVFAVRQGPVLAKNLRLAARKKKLKKYIPQKQFLSLISTGNAYAVASRGPWSLQGKWLWCVKDWIDRNFMRKYQELPAMSSSLTNAGTSNRRIVLNEASLLNDEMRCGGCGGKVGSNVLHRVLDKLPIQQRDDVEIGREHSEDGVMLSLSPGHSLIQSVDYFRSFLDDQYAFGAVTANHALNDLYAMGAQAQSALAIATLPYASERITEQSLYELLSGASSVLHRVNAVLSGGHTSEGAELAFGLSVNGIVEKGKEWRKEGLQEGDALILTKPIGTGTLFAADMRGKVKSAHLEAAVESMLQSNYEAMICMRNFDVHACTDITGFGLVGHMLEMLKASRVSASLKLDSIITLAGAEESASSGYLSSLHPQNIKIDKYIDASQPCKQHTRYPLLFDPQTAGGLLFAVPNMQAASCVKALHKSGYQSAAIVGSVDSGENCRVNIS